MSSAEFQTLLSLLKDNQQAPVFELPLLETRLRIDSLGTLFPPPVGIVVEELRVAGTSAEWVSSPDSDPTRLVLYLHGGGYCAGSLLSHRGLAGHIASAAKARVLVLDYRLAPDNPFPAALDDAVAAYEWLVGSTPDARKVAIGGDSAGGGLSIATLIALRNSGQNLPACTFVISAWADLELTGESHSTRAEVDPIITAKGLKLSAERYLAGQDSRHSLASPIYGDLSGLPPMLIQVGDAETLLDDSKKLAERARDAGVEVSLEVWPEMVHIWPVFGPAIPESARAVARIGEFVRHHIP